MRSSQSLPVRFVLMNKNVNATNRQQMSQNDARLQGLPTDGTPSYVSRTTAITSAHLSTPRSDVYFCCVSSSVLNRCVIKTGLAGRLLSARRRDCRKQSSSTLLVTAKQEMPDSNLFKYDMILIGLGASESPAVNSFSALRARLIIR